MMLLQCSITDFAEIAIALGALVVAYFSYRSGEKIDRLATINEQLIEQTKIFSDQSAIFSKQLELQRLITIQDRMPYFIRGNFAKNESELSHTMNFPNKGKIAKDINIMYPSEYKVKHWGNHFCDRNEKLQITLIVPEALFNEDYELEIEYNNELGERKSQLVMVLPSKNRTNIELPEDLIKN
ncbi:hypothetical protein MD537_14805 [Flavihumibacter sediminis]|nr:hypothetical protein [Flavihumibacter sediminis]